MVATQGGAFFKSETKLPGHSTFHRYFQDWILSEGSNEKHIGALEDLEKDKKRGGVGEASGQVGQLLAHL